LEVLQGNPRRTMISEGKDKNPSNPVSMTVLTNSRFPFEFPTTQGTA
jgi:hypothetical protein